jgi:hypothetical protein
VQAAPCHDGDGHLRAQTVLGSLEGTFGLLLAPKCPFSAKKIK